jgi:thioredoxin-dependent peroxiredoxin
MWKKPDPGRVGTAGCAAAMEKRPELRATIRARGLPGLPGDGSAALRRWSVRSAVGRRVDLNAGREMLTGTSTRPSTVPSRQVSRMLQPGDPAPSFELPDADLELVALEQHVGRNAIVLYFYPKDDTPGCTIEAVEFSERLDEFERAGAIVLGVSRDDVESHACFRDKHGLAVRLLSDADLDAARAYGVLQERPVEGAEAGQPRTRTAVQRSTFLIDRAGVIREALYGVGARGHAAEMLERVKRLPRR